MNAIEKVQNTVVTVKKRTAKKVLAAICSASMAMSIVAVNAFAVESGSGTTDMFQTIADSFKTGFADLASGVALIIGACIPVGVGIMGLYAAINAGKKIMTKLSS